MNATTTITTQNTAEIVKRISWTSNGSRSGPSEIATHHATPNRMPVRASTAR